MKKCLQKPLGYGSMIIACEKSEYDCLCIARLHGQAVKTSPFHGGNPGSIPGGVIRRSSQVVRHGSATP